MDNLTSVPNNPIQAFPPPAAPSPIEPPNRHWLLWLGGGLAVLALGIVIGVFSAKFLNQYQNLSQLTSTPALTLSPTTTPDLYRGPDGSAATANWKMYTNNSLNYSIEIPIDWDVNDSRFPDKGYVVIKPNNIEDFLLIISSQKNKVKSLSEWISLNGEPRQNQHKITLNDHEAILTTGTIVYQGDTLPTTTNHYYLINNNDGHSIHEVTSNEKYYPILSQILSTFKFIE